MEYCGSEGVQGRSREGWRAGKAHGARSSVVASSCDSGCIAPLWPNLIWRMTLLEASLRRACGLVSDGETGPL